MGDRCISYADATQIFDHFWRRMDIGADHIVRDLFFRDDMPQIGEGIFVIIFDADTADQCVVGNPDSAAGHRGIATNMAGLFQQDHMRTQIAEPTGGGKGGCPRTHYDSVIMLIETLGESRFHAPRRPLLGAIAAFASNHKGPQRLPRCILSSRPVGKSILLVPDYRLFGVHWSHRRCFSAAIARKNSPIRHDFVKGEYCRMALTSYSPSLRRVHGRAGVQQQ